MRAQAISPTATSMTVSGVARIDWKVRLKWSLKKKLKVASATAPFIAPVASRAGATNA
jgi:hypothetical protein